MGLKWKPDSEKSTNDPFLPPSIQSTVKTARIQNGCGEGSGGGKKLKKKK